MGLSSLELPGARPYRCYSCSKETWGTHASPPSLEAAVLSPQEMSLIFLRSPGVSPPPPSEKMKPKFSKKARVLSSLWHS